MKPAPTTAGRTSLPRGRMRVLLLLFAAAAGLGVLSLWPSGETATEAPLRGGARRPVGRATADPDSVPALALAVGRGVMKPEVGRDVFRFYNTPTPMPTRVPPMPTPVVYFLLPDFPTPTPTPTPIIPPALPFKAVGKFGPRDGPIVTLEEGGRLIVAREGDVVDGRFIVQKINRESVDFAFTGLPPDITRRLPIPLP